MRLNVHQTVKPIPLMRWLVTLACPEGGTVLWIRSWALGRPAARLSLRGAAS